MLNGGMRVPGLSSASWRLRWPPLVGPWRTRPWAWCVPLCPPAPCAGASSMELIPSREAGGMRLRHVLAQSFERAARLKGVQNAVLASVLSILMMGSVLEQAEASAAGTGVRAGATGVGGTTARVAELRPSLPLSRGVSRWAWDWLRTPAVHRVC